MLRINRVKAISRTEAGSFGFDYRLEKGLNLISSNINTRGKSSAILAVYYCLGFEEIIGGKGKKTLTSVYKTTIKDDDETSYQVLESEAWLEITNGVDVVSVKRTAEMENRNENLITVYYSTLENVNSSETYVEDMYIHSQNSTTSTHGFHAFLEKFVGLNLPHVPSNDGNEYKLYLQLLFAAMFIEQKRGWADILSAMPILNIKDAKKRVLEYLLGLDTLNNEKKRVSIKQQETSITLRWKQLWEDTHALCRRENCKISGLPGSPQILDDSFSSAVSVTTIEDNISIHDKLVELNKRREQLSIKTPRIVENFDELQRELEITENSISDLERERNSIIHTINLEKAAVKKLEDNLNTVNSDLRNNKDALKLKRMGSDLGVTSYKGYCPICGQAIQDSLLPIQNDDQTMSIEDNIKHLESQQSMVLFALNAHRQNLETAEMTQQSISARIFTLRRLAKTIRSDLFSVDDNLSETIVYERINTENRIQALGKLNVEVEKRITQFAELSIEWANYLLDKNTLPKSNFTKNDEEKINALENSFKYFLRAFNYQSVSNLDSVQISRENYLPISEGFDMKFDSSASDNIRAIWAYTLAVLKTSVEKGGNHPQIIIFDEPAQHSIVTADTVSLFQEVINLPGENQVIMGITLSDPEIREAVEGIDKEKITIIDVGNHAFKVY